MLFSGRKRTGARRRGGQGGPVVLGGGEGPTLSSPWVRRGPLVGGPQDGRQSQRVPLISDGSQEAQGGLR